MTINLNFDETVSVYSTVLSVLRGVHAGEIDANDPAILKIIELGELDEARIVAYENAIQDFGDAIESSTKVASEKLSIVEAAYTPKQS